MPPGSLGLRVLYSALLGIGLALTGYGSIFLQNTPMIPWGLVPDLRGAALFMTGFLSGLAASGGGVGRRRYALWSAIGIVVLFHLEEATVHWIGPYPGSITGTRVGILGTAGSLLALASVLLLHVEVEGGRLRRDLLRRGASEAGAESVRMALVGVGARRVMGLAAGVAGLAVLVRAGEAIFGDRARGGVWVLFIGAALLLGLALVLLRIAKPRQAEPDAADEQAPEQP